jgi:protein-S-isoprenylcysteine O-methyltransferase Ste14
MVAVVIPATILLFTGPDTFDLWQFYPATRVGLPTLGGVLICPGRVLMVATIRLFVTVGQGTLALWNPTQRLVVQGVYRHVHNPMIAGVFFILIGESVLAASLPLLGWFALAVTVNAMYIPLAEEPGLVRRFGDEYRVYKQNVPRWIPRVRPWRARRIQPSQETPNRNSDHGFGMFVDCAATACQRPCRLTHTRRYRN